MDGINPHFTIGHHDSSRPLPVTRDAVKSAQIANYDLVTSPITTPHFHSRVLASLSSFLSDSVRSSNTDVTSASNASPVKISPLGPADTPLAPNETINSIIGVTSSWIDLASPDPVIADISRQVLQLELTYAAFCGITYVLIPGPKLKGEGAGGSDVVQFARAVLDAIGQGPYMSFFIWLPMIDHAESQKESMGDLAPFARAPYIEDLDLDTKRLDLYGTWQVWDTIRSVCKYSTRLGVVPRILPPVAIQSRWYSEPVRMMTLDGNVFTKNAKGYPVLSKAHQALVSRFVHFKLPSVWFLLCDVGSIPMTAFDGPPTTDPSSFPTLAESNANPSLKDSTPHLSYMRNLQTKLPMQTAAERFGAGYQDYLQAPLQPLTVNLESITYEVFEKDPIKYEWYERATARALHDWIEEGKPTSNPDGRVVVAVVGAGRGPLVTRALRASEAVGVEIDIWALEKNPNAFVLLQRHNETIWDDKVNLVKSDMRTWRGPVRPANLKDIRKSFNLDADEEAPSATGQADATKTSDQGFTGSVETDQNYLLATAKSQPTNYKIDILISELLGSFGDNELSPECLDGVQHLLNPIHGISIPRSYTAFITPIAAPKLHADISLTMTSTVPHAAEIPYVVMFNAIDFLSTREVPTQSQSHSQQSSASNNQTLSDTSNHKEQQLQHQSYSSVARATSDTNTSNLAPTTPMATISPTWSFHHPNHSLPSIAANAAPTSNSHNTRHISLTFPIPNRGSCHGLAGYFESVLYPGVELSTNPLTMEKKSEGMVSWFPIYFPLKTPIYVPDNGEMVVNMWRQSDERRIWYEWIIDVYHVVEEGQESRKKEREDKIKKKMGKRRVRIAGTELHSSEKEACLM